MKPPALEALLQEHPEICQFPVMLRVGHTVRENRHTDANTGSPSSPKSWKETETSEPYFINGERANRAHTPPHGTPTPRATGFNLVRGARLERSRTATP